MTIYQLIRELAQYDPEETVRVLHLPHRSGDQEQFAITETYAADNDGETFVALQVEEF